MHTPGRYHTQWSIASPLRVLLSASLLLLGIIILVLSLWQGMENVVEDGIVDKSILPAKPTPMALLLPDNTEIIDPGILPDNPFYLIHMLHDRVRIWLHTDPVDKSRLYREYADRRLSAATILLSKGKPDIAVETLWKAEGYLMKAQHSLNSCEATPEVFAEWQALLQTVDAHTEAILMMRSVVPEQLHQPLNKIAEQLMTVKARAREVCDKDELGIDLTK